MSFDVFKLDAVRFNNFARRYVSPKFNYAILVPTLRCNLSCSYCQVSRVNENLTGYDWDETTTLSTIELLLSNCTEDLKIEFQGGEPSLRIDIITKVIEAIEEKVSNPSFVICSNLQKLDKKFLKILERTNVHLSCSLDGPSILHQKHRTKSDKLTSEFYNNLKLVRNQFGDSKISLLTTISNYDKIIDVIDFYFEEKIPEIFLRPVNFQGFARKKFKEESQDYDAWQKAYEGGIEYIFGRNKTGEHKLIETNFSLHLAKFFKPRENGYVDLRNPNPLGKDYVVVDFDGKLYPTDEARMLSRIGLIDLSIGNVLIGIDKNIANEINYRSSNDYDEICVACQFQNFCGVDNIDKLSRYGTLDVNTNETSFCKSHFSMFSFVKTKIESENPNDIRNLMLHLTGHFSECTLFRDWFHD